MKALAMLLCWSTLALPAGGSGQANPIKLVKVNATSSIAPGQMVELVVDGLPEGLGIDSPEDQPEVSILQQGAHHQARVRMAFVMPLPASYIDPKASGIKAYKIVIITVPDGLVAGRATISVGHKGRVSNESEIRIGERPPRPFVAIPVSTTDGQPPTRIDEKDSPALRLERGKESEVSIYPLVDPDQADSALIVTFTQSAFSLQSATRVIKHDGTMESDRTWRSPGFAAMVAVPDRLATGKATIEIQIKARGQLSDPYSREVEIIDPAASTDDPRLMAPELLGLTSSRIGIGQAVTLMVDRRSLEPDPSKVVVTIEQDSKRETLKPELNRAAFRAFKESSTPAILIARVGSEITGSAEVRIINPSLAQQASASRALRIEIVDEVLPPKLISVSDASSADLFQLRQLRKASLAAGHEFKEYVPGRRYITIRAAGLDYNPNFVIVNIEQRGKSFTLNYDDFSLQIDDRRTVRLPDGIEPGPIRVTVMNVGAGRFSEPDSITAEIAAPKAEQ